jgi:hypothetical protein
LGAKFLGGVVGSTGNSKPGANASYDAYCAIDRMRDAIGPHHADVLEMAITDASAREIGEGFGYRNQYAERKGVALVDAAISAARNIAA